MYSKSDQSHAISSLKYVGRDPMDGDVRIDSQRELFFSTGMSSMGTSDIEY